MNDEEQKAITDGLVPIPGEASAPALGSAREHFHNSAEGESDEELVGALDDGYANKSLDDVDGTPGGGGRGMTMTEMQETMDHLAKGQAMIAEKPGLLMVAIGSKQGSTNPPATPKRTSENPWALAMQGTYTSENPTPPSAAEEPSDAQRQIEHARQLAICRSSLKGFDSTSVTVSSPIGEIQDAKEAAGSLYLQVGWRTSY